MWQVIPYNLILRGTSNRRVGLLNQTPAEGSLSLGKEDCPASSQISKICESFSSFLTHFSENSLHKFRTELLDESQNYLEKNFLMETFFDKIICHGAFAVVFPLEDDSVV
jgi:hypothetical protein